jgi:hypothetical protein
MRESDDLFSWVSLNVETACRGQHTDDFVERDGFHELRFLDDGVDGL